VDELNKFVSGKDNFITTNELPYCFTLQSCFGHFVFCGQNDQQNLEPLPVNDPIVKVEYRIAYI